MVTNSIHRKTLNTKQLSILDLLYLFRFGTTELLAEALEGSKIKMNERLKVLLEQDYIGRNYEPEYRLLRKHASYYLLPKGIKVLRGTGDNYDSNILHSIYKDKSASEQFINHSLAVFRAYCQLKNKYGDSLRFFTKSKLTQFEYFPNPLPDAYIRLESEHGEKQYFLEILQSTRPYFVSVRKARRYVTYAEEGEWEDTGTDLPSIVLICDTETLKKRLDNHLDKLTNETDELQFIATLNITEVT